MSHAESVPGLAACGTIPRRIFASGSLARRIEEAEATLIGDFGRAVAARLGPDQVIVSEVGGGMAVLAGAGSPFSKVSGLGFEPLEDSALDDLEAGFARHHSPVRVELATLADPAVASCLNHRGYVLVGFENVLGLELGDPPPPGARGIIVSRAAAHESRQWLDVLGTGFSHPDTYDGPRPQAVPERSAIDQAMEDMGRVGGLERYFARIDGDVVGGASMRLWKGVAQLCGAATLPEHRRRGVQTTLLRERLADAARHGCDLAIVTTEPGSRSQENAQRQGFALLYSRAILIRS
jgi:GNAT superfamily N-acetyltransferase